MGPRRSSGGKHACELTHYGEPSFIGTLAAAYADAGRFLDDAIAVRGKAGARRPGRGNPHLLKKNQELLATLPRAQTVSRNALKPWRWIFFIAVDAATKRSADMEFNA